MADSTEVGAAPFKFSSFARENNQPAADGSPCEATSRTFKSSINTSTPDEEDTYSMSTEADMNATQRSLCKLADVRVVATNGSAIPTCSYENLTLSFERVNLIGSFSLLTSHCQSSVRIPSLSFHLLFDVAQQRLVNADVYLSTPLQPAPSNLALHISAPKNAYAHLLISYPEVFRPELRQTPTVPAKHGIYHHIKKTPPPDFAKLRCLAPDQLATAKQMLAEMEEMGLCQKASSPMVVSLIHRPEEDGSLRLCGDYRRLNMQNRTGSIPSQTSPM
ncbi:uncharacterized protein [Palaemon carinicauda]|uniref:uncharacterized protein n=1 Tax=Palaemon carinicauda TaxID=392227 RepID=UPI0035B5BE9E